MVLKRAALIAGVLVLASAGAATAAHCMTKPATSYCADRGYPGVYAEIAPAVSVLRQQLDR